MGLSFLMSAVSVPTEPADKGGCCSGGNQSADNNSSSILLEKLPGNTPRDLNEMISNIETVLGLTLQPEARHAVLAIMRDYFAQRFSALTLSSDQSISKKAHELFNSIFQKRGIA